MKILVINAGSSSLKYQLFDMAKTTIMAGGSLERIGDSNGTWTHFVVTSDPSGQAADQKENSVQKREISDHRQAMQLAVSLIIDPQKGVIDDISQIAAVGHRVVQGGEAFGSASRVNGHVKNTIKDNFPLAPLHNPPNLTGIEVAEKLLPGIPNIAVFDTQFHQTLPTKAFLYALPYEFYTQFNIRRYGFHGTSHKYVAHQAAELMNQKIDQLNLITIHLGNGCSISAVKKGRCIDTSMGMTPLTGVMMGTRTGDMDPAIIGYLVKHTGMTIEELGVILNKKSGLKGICGSNDMRDIHDSIKKGDSKAALAIEMFCYQIKKYIGAYAAALGTVDGIVFTAGIGENDDIIREKVCENMAGIGIEIDLGKNNLPGSAARAVHRKNSRVAICVIPTNEELQIARETLEVLQAG